GRGHARCARGARGARAVRDAVSLRERAPRHAARGDDRDDARWAVRDPRRRRRQSGAEPALHREHARSLRAAGRARQRARRHRRKLDQRQRDPLSRDAPPRLPFHREKQMTTAAEGERPVGRVRAWELALVVALLLATYLPRLGSYSLWDPWES